MNISLFDIQFDATTGGGSITITVTGDLTVDAITVTANDVIANSSTYTVNCNTGKDITIAGSATITGGTFTQFKSFSVTTATVQTYTAATFHGLNATTAWDNGPDISIGTGAGVAAGSCTLTHNKVGFNATSGWLLQKLVTTSNYIFMGVLASSETAPAGYRAANATADFTTKVADVYATPFNTSYTLGANMTSVTTMTVDASTTVDTSLASSWGLTCSGDVSVSGTITGRASAISFKDLTIGATGTYTGTSGTTTITSETTGTNIAWSNTAGGTFTSSGGKVDFQGQNSPYLILGDNSWDTLEISLTNACEYQFEDGKTQDVAVHCHISGSALNILTLRSTIDGNHWNLDLGVGCTQDFVYLDVMDSDASGGLQCVASNSTDSLNNHNWLFTSGVFAWDGGAVDNLASSGDNWSGDVAPGTTDDVLFAASAKDCTWDIDSVSGYVDIHSNYTGAITLDNDVVWTTLDALGGDFDTAGYDLEVTGVTTVDNDFEINDSACTFGDDLTISSVGIFTGTNAGGGSIDMADAATITVTGILDINGNGSDFTITWAGTSAGSVLTGAGAISLDEVIVDGAREIIIFTASTWVITACHIYNTLNYSLDWVGVPTNVTISSLSVGDGINGFYVNAAASGVLLFTATNVRFNEDPTGAAANHSGSDIRVPNTANGVYNFTTVTWSPASANPDITIAVGRAGIATDGNNGTASNIYVFGEVSMSELLVPPVNTDNVTVWDVTTGDTVFDTDTVEQISDFILKGNAEVDLTENLTISALKSITCGAASEIDFTAGKSVTFL
jgi:hypothetical protein